MLWCNIGINMKDVMSLRIENKGHATDRNGLAQETGPHAYVVELTDKDREETWRHMIVHRREDPMYDLIIRALEEYKHHVEELAKLEVEDG